MWRRIDTNLYLSLKSKIGKEFFPDFVGGIIVSVLCFGAIAYSAPKTNAGIEAFILLAVSAVMFFIFLTLNRISAGKNKKALEAMKKNNAEYCEGVLVRKLGGSSLTDNDDIDSKIFSAYVEFDGKTRKIKCTSDIAAECNSGDRIYVVDMIGFKGKNAGTCIAVKTLEAPESIFDRKELDDTISELKQKMENDGIFIPAVKNEEKADEPVPLSEDDRNYILSSERKRLRLTLIPFPVTLIFFIPLFLVSSGIMTPATGNKALNGILIYISHGLSMPLMLLTVFSFFIALGYSLEAIQLISELKKNKPTAQKLTIKSVFTSPGKHRQTVTVYSYRCITESGGQQIVHSKQRIKIEKDEKVIAVYYKKGCTKLYHQRDQHNTGA